MKSISCATLALCVFAGFSCGSKETVSRSGGPPAKAAQTSPAPGKTTTTESKGINSVTEPGRFVHTTPAPVILKITNPKTAEEHLAVAIDRHMHNKLDEAIEEYKKALALKPNSALAHFRLGNAYDQKHNREAAIAEWKETIRLDPHYLDAYNALTVAYKEKGDLRTAAEYYEHLLEFPPARTVVHYRLGFWYKQLGDKEKARQHLESYIDLALNPRSKEAGTDRYQKAVRALESVKAKT